MKFIILFALVAAAASAEQVNPDGRILNIIGGILNILNQRPGGISVGPAIVDKEYEPISVGPAIVDKEYEPISVGPAIVEEEYEQISVGPAIVDEEHEDISVDPVIIDETPSPVVPSPVPSPFPFPISSPLVQLTMNINNN